MLWFRKNPPTNPTLEIDARRGMNKEAVARATTATDRLNRVFENDGFTVKIAAAMGAKQQREVKSGN